MTIAIGCDHGGFECKQQVVKYLLEKGYKITDVGTYSLDSCHYPLFGEAVADNVAKNKADFGIVICTSGEGICMAANKVKGIRCGIGYNDEVSELMRRHNNANVISFGAKFMKIEDILRRIDIFLSTPFEGGRHETRVNLITDIENK